LYTTAPSHPLESDYDVDLTFDVPSLPASRSVASDRHDNVESAKDEPSGPAPRKQMKPRQQVLTPQALNSRDKVTPAKKSGASDSSSKWSFQSQQVHVPSPFVSSPALNNEFKNDRLATSRPMESLPHEDNVQSQSVHDPPGRLPAHVLRVPQDPHRAMSMMMRQQHDALIDMENMAMQAYDRLNLQANLKRRRQQAFIDMQESRIPLAEFFLTQKFKYVLSALDGRLISS